MRTKFAPFVLMSILLTLLAGQVFAQEPVKWSAPMSAYPNRWVPSQVPPPAYNNQYGNQNPYGGYWPGYGYAGYPPYGNTNQGWNQQNPQYPQNGFSGNPYMYR